MTEIATSKPGASIRLPAVAGTFYPGEPGALRATIAQCLSSVTLKHGPSKALVVPHAGYVYSGPIAATAYASVAPMRGTITRVVLLGPSHRVAFDGLAVPSVAAFRTPLGDIPIDRAAIARVGALKGVATLDAAHAQEHALEVQLPFLQEVLGAFQLVPIVVGRARPEMVEAVLAALWGGDETLILISSDLSHYHDYAAAQKMDAAASHAIETLAGDKLGDDQACGRIAVRGLLRRARALDLRATTLDLRNSGDTAGAKDKVVGYGSYAFEYAGRARLSDEYRRFLGEIAKAAIKRGIKSKADLRLKLANVPRPLMSVRASFVTVTLDDNLRGCIGSVTPHQALAVDVATSAYKAAFSDPRFPPVTAREADRLEIGVSILSTLRPIRIGSEVELVDALNPDVDGVVLTEGDRRGLFLPQVWDGVRDAKEFVRRLKVKAGLKPDHWSARIKAYRFTTESFRAA